MPPNMFAIGQGMLGPTIMAHGTPEQKKRYLEPMLRADEVWCQLFSEPAAGSDLAGLRTTAVKDGDDWVLNGQKIWTTGRALLRLGDDRHAHRSDAPRSTRASPTSSST